MDIGTKIKEARIASQLTQEQVAETLGVTRQTVSNWENEKTYPDIINIVKLSDLYKISLDELLKGDSNILRHFKKSTDTVKSNLRLCIIGIINIIIIIALLIFMRDSGSIIFWATLFGEFVLLCVADISCAPHIRQHFRIISSVVMLLCVIICIGLVLLCSMLALDSFETGNTASGIKLIVTAIVIAFSAYILFIRKFVEIFSKNK